MPEPLLILQEQGVSNMVHSVSARTGRTRTSQERAADRMSSNVADMTLH